MSAPFRPGRDYPERHRGSLALPVFMLSGQANRIDVRLRVASGGSSRWFQSGFRQRPCSGFEGCPRPFDRQSQSRVLDVDEQDRSVRREGRARQLVVAGEDVRPIV